MFRILAPISAARAGRTFSRSQANAPVRICSTKYEAGAAATDGGRLLHHRTSYASPKVQSLVSGTRAGGPENFREVEMYLCIEG